MQFDIVLEYDGARVPDALGNDHPAAALTCERLDRIGEGPGRKRMSVARAAEVRDADRTVGNRGARDRREGKRQLGIR